ncbi:MAG: hypothetical protein ACJASM_001564 [Salibacteraceae bacterium]|jgi:hypothetical protein
MKKRIIGSFLTLGLICAISIAKGQTVSNFENVLTGGDSTWNGSDLSNGVVNGAGFFLNDYNPRWGSWSGFSISKTTDTVTGGWANQYSSISGNGANNSAAYAVSYSNSTVMFTHSVGGDSIKGLSINNSTYAYRNMQTGDAFTKKFGGTTGNDPDFLTVTFFGYDADFVMTDSVVFYLADFRDANNANDYLVKDWTWVDLSSLGRIRYLDMEFNSSDVGQFGINTPTYACIDSLVYKNSSTLFQPLAAVLDYQVGYNSAVANYNVTKHSINPGNTVDSLTATLVDQPSNGTAVLISDSLISYKPMASFNGYDTVWFSICNQGNICDTSWIEFLVNDVPIAANDTFTRGGDGVLELDILANDWDEQIANLRVSLLDTTKNGNVSIVANKLEYIADTDFEGLDTCSYLICDLYGYCDTGYVYLKIQNVVGVSEISISSISFYPNPTNGIVKIAGLSNEITALRVLNIRGEAIETALNTENEFDLSEASNGVYFISISTANKTITKRIIKL